MSELPLDGRIQDRWTGLKLVATHVSITLIALAISFSLPSVAQYILYQWWPLVTSDAKLLLVSEIGLAAALTLVFNFWRVTSSNSSKGRLADTAALVYVRHRPGWLARLRERSLIRKLPPARDASIMTVTGWDTFSSEKSLLHGPLQSAYEIRVMLLDPGAESALRRVRSLSGLVTRQKYVDEVSASIAYLARLRAMGRKVTLKFYEHEPFWKVVVLGGHLWVQYCHRGYELKQDPEYVFALNPEHPRLGLFVPFQMHFLDHWNDPRHPEYDFDTGVLVYRDGQGTEVQRKPLARKGEGDVEMQPS